MKVFRIGQNSRIGACTILPLWILAMTRTEPLSSAATQHKPIGEVLLKVSQEMLAEMIGSTRPSVNFFMNNFRKLGFIEYNGEIHVNHSLLSVVLHD